MLTLALDQPQRILCLGAHSDDIEIGCGATLMSLIQANRSLAVRWVVFSGDTARQAEARASAGELLEGVERQKVDLHGFRESFFPTQLSEIKETFERLKRDFDPDVVFTHYKDDAHQDHRVVAEATWNTFRNHLVLEYEIPKFEDDLGHPNVFVPAERATAQRKIDGLQRHFPSQRHRRWFTPETFLALMRLRGVNANSPTGLAEGFHCRKLLLEARQDFKGAAAPRRPTT